MGGGARDSVRRSFQFLSISARKKSVARAVRSGRIPPLRPRAARHRARHDVRRRPHRLLDLRLLRRVRRLLERRSRTLHAVGRLDGVLGQGRLLVGLLGGAAGARDALLTRRVQQRTDFRSLRVDALLLRDERRERGVRIVVRGQHLRHLREGRRVRGRMCLRLGRSTAVLHVHAHRPAFVREGLRARTRVRPLKEAALVAKLRKRCTVSHV